MESSIHGLWKRLDEKAKEAQRALGVADPVSPVEPPSEEFGHLGFPVFSLAKELKRNPNDIAREVAERIAPDDLVGRVSSLKGFVNLFFNEEALADAVLREILDRKDAFAAGGTARPERWVLEYSSPNTNKPLHLGHIRNNLLGVAISNLARYFGHDVVKANLINDRGIHICKTMLAYRLWGGERTPEGEGIKGDHFVGSLYVRFENELKKEFQEWRQATGQDLAEDDYFNSHSPLGREVHRLLQEWEQGVPETLALWKQMNRWVLDGFHKTYGRMGCTFDLIQYESETYKLGKEMVARGLEQGLFFRRDDGAVVYRFDGQEGEAEKVLLRPDGTSLYITQDLGTAMSRLERFTPERLVYVVGDEQIYHFKLLFRILGLLSPGRGLEEKCHHLSYGMVRLPEGRMKSREGKVVDADDLMDELYCLAREELTSRSDEGRAHTEGVTEAALAERAEKIAQAALKFFVFRFTPRKSFEYNPKQSIDFNGQTGPYCLYCYARTRSLVRKSGSQPIFRPELAARLTHPWERQVVRKLFTYPLAVGRAAQTLDPSKMADYAFALSSGFARMFTDKIGYPIITCPDEELRQARLMLAEAVGITLRSALALLGIEVLEEM
jgi:arginyl-tRNA synthetase